KVFVVDAGEGASEMIARMGIDPGLIDSLLLTHFHSDHIGGLGSVNLQRWVSERSSTAMKVFGPPGVEQVIAGYNAAYELDRSYRVGHHGEELVDPTVGPMVPEEFPVPGEGQSDVV